ncbi:hypothetical protein IWX47DRAFT_401168 [Phyllosticta citricarpa]
MSIIHLYLQKGARSVAVQHSPREKSSSIMPQNKPLCSTSFQRDYALGNKTTVSREMCASTNSGTTLLDCTSPRRRSFFTRDMMVFGCFQDHTAASISLLLSLNQFLALKGDRQANYLVKMMECGIDLSELSNGRREKQNGIISLTRASQRLHPLAFPCSYASVPSYAEHPTHLSIQMFVVIIVVVWSLFFDDLLCA